MATYRWSVLGFGAPLALVLSLGAGSAARLHYPLPPDSHARNGAPQHKTSHVHTPAQNLKVAPPVRKGLHPKAALGLKRRYAGSPVDVLRYHNDNYPTGWNQSETDLTPATVGSASFGQLTTLNVDGNVMAEPLMVSNFTMPDSTTHNVLIVATGHNTIYAYDAQTYDILWQRNLGPSQSTADVGCDDIKPEYGISSTPVIVRTASNAATLYVVAATEPAPFSFHTQLHAIDLGTGNDIRKPREIAPTGKLTTGGKIHFDPQNQWSRSALVYNNGSIYMGIGSHCDNNAGGISGWVLRYDASTLKLTAKFNTIRASASYELSSVWMSGYSVAIDPDGNVYAVTGNGNYDLGHGQKGYGESVLKLSPSFGKKPLGTFTPSEWQTLNDEDNDFGSGGAMLIPVAGGQTTPASLVAMGKSATMYLLDIDNLNGLEGKNGYQALQKFQIDPCWCGPAYYSGSSGGVVFYQGSYDQLRAYSVATTGTPGLTQVATSSDFAGFGGSFPVVSSNGSNPGTAVVWAIERGPGYEELAAYNAQTLGNPLFRQVAGSWSNGNGSYLTPLVANGRVYVGAYQTVAVYGLTD
jgi:hypothetical protein